MNRDRFRYYDLLVHTFVVILLISNLVGQKITAVGPFRFSGAMLFFPITYIFGDVFNEVYGYGASRRQCWRPWELSRCGCRPRPDGMARRPSRGSSTSCRGSSLPAWPPFGAA